MQQVLEGAQSQMQNGFFYAIMSVCKVHIEERI